ncbi:MAG: hypothetical protein ABIH04_05385 [Planctomycetota bacterium]
MIAGNKTILLYAFLAVLPILFTAASCGAEGGKDDPAKPEQSKTAREFLREYLGEEGEKATAAFSRDMAAGTTKSLEELCKDDDAVPEAMLALVLAAWAGNEGAQAVIEDFAVEGDDERGLLAIIGTSFLEHKKSIPLLIKRLEKSNEKSYFRGVAGVVLARITGCDLSPEPEKWKEWWAQRRTIFIPRKILDWELLDFELANSSLVSQWRFRIGLEKDFVAALREADIYLKRFGTGDDLLSDALVLVNGSEFDKALSEVPKVIVREPLNIYLRYLHAAMLMQADKFKQARAAYETIAKMNSACPSAVLLEQYCRKIAEVEETPPDREKRLETFMSLVEKADGNISPFGWDVPSMYLSEKMLALDGKAVSALAKKQPEGTTFAGCLLLMNPEDALKAAEGSLEETANSKPVLDACLQALCRISLGLIPGDEENSREILGKMQKVLTALAEKDKDNGLYAALQVYVELLHDENRFDEKGRPTALTAKQVEALGKALAAKKLDLLDREMIQALVSALEELRHPMPRSFTLAAIGQVSMSRSGVRELSERLQTNISNAIVKGDDEEAERIAELMENMAGKIAAQQGFFANAYLARDVRSRIYYGRAEGLRLLKKFEEAKAVIKELGEVRAKTGLPTVHPARYTLLMRLPVPALAEMVAAALLEDEVAFYKKYEKQP